MITVSMAAFWGLVIAGFAIGYLVRALIASEHHKRQRDSFGDLDWLMVDLVDLLMATGEYYRLPPSIIRRIRDWKSERSRGES